jgi:AraC family transcriptional regulator
MSVANAIITHGIVSRPGNRVRATSEELGWGSVLASVQRELPFDGVFPAVDDHLLVVHLSGPVRVRGMIRDNAVARTVPPGHVFLWPGGESFHIELENTADTLHIYLKRHLIKEVMAELGIDNADAIRLTPRLGESDPLLESLALEVRSCLSRSDRRTSLYVEQVARMMAARLVHEHSNFTTPVAPPSHSNLRRTQIDRINDFIDANLARKIDLPELAEAAGLSATWFVRRLQVATGLPPNQYVLSRRIGYAKRLLTETDLSIAAIAFDCGFAHQEHLTRTFRKFTGTTPGAYRKSHFR